MISYHISTVQVWYDFILLALRHFVLSLSVCEICKILALTFSYVTFMATNVDVVLERLTLFHSIWKLAIDKPSVAVLLM